MLKPLTIIGRFECGLADAVANRGPWAFTPVVGFAGKFRLGVAFADEPGYMPVPQTWCHADTYDEMADHAEALKIEGDLVKAVDMAARTFGVTETEKPSILRHLIEGGDLSRFGLFNAITRTAEDLDDYDRATDLERMGGDVIELPANQWRLIAEAA